MQFLDEEEMTSMKQVIFSNETNNTIYYNYGKDLFDFDRDLKIKEHDFGIEKIVSGAISKNGKYLALSYMDKKKKPHTILFDDEDNILYDIKKYYFIQFIDNNAKHVFCEDYGITTDMVVWGSDVEPPMQTLEVFSRNGRRINRFVLPDISYTNIKISEDGNYVILVYFADTILEGTVFNREGVRLFPALKKARIKIFAVSPDNNHFLGYKKENKTEGVLYLIDKAGEVLWSKRRKAVGDCVFSEDGNFILGTSWFTTKKVVEEIEEEVTYPVVKKVNIPIYEKVNRVFLYDVKGDLLWEKRVDVYSDFKARLSNAITENGEFIIILTGPTSYNLKVNSIICLDKKGAILWETPELDIDNAFISKDGKWIYAIGLTNIYKFKNIAIK